jgi:hypothetical protein
MASNKCARQYDAGLKRGAEYRLQRINGADMITTEQAAEMSGTTRVTINAWIKSGRCIGVAHLRRGFKMPKWQFEPYIFPVIQPMSMSKEIDIPMIYRVLMTKTLTHLSPEFPNRRQFSSQFCYVNMAVQDCAAL